ncbi:MAG TPA: glycosyltransferase [Pyrinomonadaceae bacterium]|nr:glycosyltransferase [Pyrinomonadaceae bacterium]
MKVYYFFAAFIVWQGIVSLQGGVRYLRFFREALATPESKYTPFVTVLAPCKGLDQGLRENLAALFRQDYPVYEIIFAVEREEDEAAATINELRREFADSPTVSARLVVAGRAAAGGQKIHNLLAAMREAASEIEVFVFVDSDARPGPSWLRNLTAPLGDEKIGAATGYRWFLPRRRNAASLLRAVWNASVASALGPNDARNFCWGGSTAIRRSTFENLRMNEQWRGGVSDDFGLTNALQREKMPIRFVPQCLIASHEECSFRELVEFTTRQMKITRVYAPHFWKIVLVTGTIFAGVFFGGLVVVGHGLLTGKGFIPPLMFVAVIFLLGAGKAVYRLRAVGLVLGGDRRESAAGAAAHLLWWPAASLLFTINAYAALFSRRITWRGITYELKSPVETVIIER